MLSGAATIEFEGKKLWPKNATLFQPSEANQMLLPELACCVGIQAFLRMNKLTYDIEERRNAEFMSPTGRVPFMQIDRMLVADVQPIMEYVTNRGHNLGEHLNETDAAEKKAYLALLETLYNAELYLMWQDKEMYNEVTWNRYGHVFSWPLNYIVTYQKKKTVLAKLKAIGWKSKSQQDVCAEVEKCCKALNEKLGNKQYFFGDKPTELDAMVYGHLYSMIKIKLPVDLFSNTVISFNNLTSFVDRINSNYFS